MVMEEQLISIIIPCYNQGQYLHETLTSVSKQTYENWECIIVNDGSQDQTESIALQWQIKDKRFKYIKKSNEGLSSARNAGLDVCNGSYIQFLDADDYLQHQKIDLSYKEIMGKQGDLVLTDFEMFTENLNETKPAFCKLKEDYFNYNSILTKWDHLFSIPIHCGLFKSDFFKNFRFPIGLSAKEDWILWISFFKEQPKTIFIQDSLVLYRLHENSMTQDKNFMSENTVLALVHLRDILSEEDYKKVLSCKFKILENEVSFLKEKLSLEKKNFRAIKDSNSYKLGYKLRAILKSLRMLKIIKMLVLKK